MTQNQFIGAKQIEVAIDSIESWLTQISIQANGGLMPPNLWKHHKEITAWLKERKTRLEGEFASL